MMALVAAFVVVGDEAAEGRAREIDMLGSCVNKCVALVG
jgi:hypothetical protein